MIAWDVHVWRRSTFTADCKRQGIREQKPTLTRTVDWQGEKESFFLFQPCFLEKLEPATKRSLQASDGGVDPYAVLTLTDPKKVKPEVQQSYMMHNEPSPHWNQKFDFAMVSATSTLGIQVFDKKSTMQTVLSNPVKSIAGKVTGALSESSARKAGHCFSQR